jgi:Xaa-Pro aminopeptidase
MRRHELDALIVSDFPEAPQPAYARYLSGFHLSPAIGAVNHVVLLRLEGDATLVIPPGQKRSFAHLAAARSWIPNVVTTYRDDFEWEVKTRWGHLATDLAEPVIEAIRAAELDEARIGIAGTWSGLDEAQRQLPNATFVPTITLGADGQREDVLVELVRTNSEWEIERLEIAQRAADAATRAYVGAARGGGGTREAFVDAESAAKTEGVDQVTLFGSAGVGPWAFWDLAHPAAEEFVSDRMYFVEVALAGWAGFGIQSGRTFVPGDPSERQRHLVDSSLKALSALQATIRQGVPGSEVWSAGLAVARNAGLDVWAQFGHYKGLLPPSASGRIAFMPGDTNKLVSGQTVVLHPGLFDRESGDATFIGDTVLVQDDGYRLFTDTPLGYGLGEI